jgi:3-dehydroquinate synthase
MTLYGISRLKALFKKHHPSDVVVVTSKKILHAHPWALREIKVIANVPVKVIYVVDGERAKDFREFEKLLKLFIKNNVTRSSMIVAMGGGSIGDVTGFAASVYLRGILYIQLPTTLLACVDSAIGGKTAANLASYKNNIGSFYLPLATCIDARFLKSLPREQWINGLGEVVKAGLIEDINILTILNKGLSALQGDEKTLSLLIRKAIAVKESAVAQDPLDQGRRQILNFGHTVGHAVELKNNVSHGMAVLYGMRVELLVQGEMGFQYKKPLTILDDFLRQYKIIFPRKITIDYSAIAHDKKAKGSMITIPIVEQPGSVRLISISTKKYCDYIRQAVLGGEK